MKFVHSLRIWSNKVKARGGRYAIAWLILVGAYYAFDFKYIPWLANKYEYLAFIPLYPSIFFACWAGVYVYDLFNRDVYFIESISLWLHEEGSNKLSRSIKAFINRNPKNVFLTISVWYSPLHAYLFFREDKKNEIVTMLKMLAKGSFYCALFWGAVVDLLIFIWRLAKPYM